MNLYNRLCRKMVKRIGLKAMVKDDMAVGIIDDFMIEVIDEGIVDARLTVNYIIDYGDMKRFINENMVVILEEPKKSI